MTITDDERLEIINRGKRARGQLDGVLSMLEDDRASAEVVSQMGAASTAIGRAARRLVAVSLLQACSEAHDSGGPSEHEVDQLLHALA